MGSHRQARVRELLKRQLGEVIRRELPVDQAGLITVNDVDVSGDLRAATVYIGILGNSDQQRNGLLLLQRNRIRIQSMVARSVILRYTPQLRFATDDSIIRGNRVMQIIEEIERNSPPESTQ